jgi:hypothetical protein
VSKITASAHDSTGANNNVPDLPSLAREWLHHEASGARLRLAHRFVEWDGWEEGLVDSILGPEEEEEEWFRDACPPKGVSAGKSSGRERAHAQTSGQLNGASDAEEEQEEEGTSGGGVSQDKWGSSNGKPDTRAPQKCRTLEIAGDVCGGRGGELGRRLEAWLSVNESESGAMRC